MFALMQLLGGVVAAVIIRTLWPTKVSV
jgi:hypothetical protein